MINKIRLLELWLTDTTFRTNYRALTYRLKFGIHAGTTLKELFETKKGTRYVLFLKNHTKNDRFKHIITSAGQAQLLLM